MTKALSYLRRFGAYLTPARRRALYVLLAAVLGLASTFGAIDAGQADALLSQADKILGALALLLAAANVERAPDASPDE